MVFIPFTLAAPRYPALCICQTLQEWQRDCHTRKPAPRMDFLRPRVGPGPIAATGKQITLTYVEPGVWFGDVAFFDGNRRTHDAYARGDTTIVCVSKEN